MRSTTNYFLAAAVGALVCSAPGVVRAQNIFTLNTNPLNGMSQDFSQPDDVETQPDGKGGIQVTLTYDDAPGAVGSSEGDLVLSTWNGTTGVANINLTNFTNYELQFTNVDPDGGAYIQPVMKIGPNWQWVQGSPNNGGAGSIGNYNDSSDPGNGATSFLMNWSLATDGSAAGSDNTGQDPTFSSDISSVREIRLAFFTPNGIVPPSGGAEFDIDPVPLIAGDLNGDGKIDSTDSAIMLANMGQSVGYGDYTVGDLNADGAVNADDQALFDLDVAKYNASLTVTPEPAVLALFALMGLPMFRYRRA